MADAGALYAIGGIAFVVVGIVLTVLFDAIRMHFRLKAYRRAHPPIVNDIPGTGDLRDGFYEIHGPGHRAPEIIEIRRD